MQFKVLFGVDQTTDGEITGEIAHSIFRDCLHHYMKALNKHNETKMCGKC